ncbi:hypothetical protein WN51_06574, partial [Melipona quadrifasciata]
KYLNILKENLEQSAIKLNLLDDFYFSTEGLYLLCCSIVEKILIIITDCVGDTTGLQYKHSHDVDPGDSIGRAMRQSSKIFHGPDHKHH